jgi:hypothetical protein
MDVAGAAWRAAPQSAGSGGHPQPTDETLTLTSCDSDYVSLWRAAAHYRGEQRAARLGAARCWLAGGGLSGACGERASARHC